MRKPYSVILEDLAPELRKEQEINILYSTIVEPAPLKEIYIARRGKGGGFRYYSGSFWYEGQKWLPERESLILVLDDRQISDVFVVSNSRAFRLTKFQALETIDLPKLRAVTVERQNFSLTALAGYFAFQNIALEKERFFSWVPGRNFFRINADGYYRLYAFWNHSFNEPNLTMISNASLYVEIDSNQRLLDTAPLRYEMATGQNRYIPVVALQGYWVCYLERSSTVRLRYELVQDLGGMPLTNTNNTGNIYLFFEKLGGVYGSRSDK